MGASGRRSHPAVGGRVLPERGVKHRNPFAFFDCLPLTPFLAIFQVMLDQPGQARGCFQPQTLQRVLEIKKRCDPLGLLKDL